MRPMSLTGVEQKKCLNYVSDLEIGNEIKVARYQNFIWSYLGQFSMHNETVKCTENGSQMDVKHASIKIDCDLLTLKLAK